MNMYNIDMDSAPFIKDNLRIVSAHKAICQPDWSWKNPSSDTYELNLWLVLKGRGRLEIPGKAYYLKAGDCFVFRHWKPHLATHDPHNPLIVPYIVYSYIGCDEKVVKPPKDSMPAFHRRIESPAFLADLMERSITAFTQGSSGQSEAVHWLKSSLLEITRRDFKPDYTGLELEQFQLVDKVCREIRQGPSVHVQIEKLAEEAGYSTDHFIRIFKKFKAVTPGEYLIQSRIKTAIELLKFSSHSITRISQLLGYSDIYAFSKQFRQKMNESPSAYRRGRKP